MKVNDWLFFALIVVIVTGILASCTTTPPVEHKVGGRVYVQTTKKCFGVPISTKTEELKTKEQKFDDLDIEKEKNKVKTTERQKAAAFWFGVGFYLAATVFVFVGYFAKGWRFFGGAAFLSFGLGVAAWSFESIVPYLKYPAYAIGGAVVLWSMWKLKNFALLEKLKNSEKGKIL
jgi:hypothetical protein